MKNLNGNKKKVLIIRLSSMGDVIFNIPLANKLKDNGYNVSWLVGEKGVGLLENNSCVDKVFFAPVEKWKKSKNIFKNISEMIGILKKLRAEHFDIALDTQMLMKSILWTRFCGAKRRIVSKDARECSFLGANEVMPKIKDGFKIHIVKSYLKFAEYLGLEVSDFRVTLPDTTQKDKVIIKDYLKDLDNSKKTVAIAPATTWVAKHWNRDNWVKLVEKLGEKYNIIFTGGKNDIDLINYISGGKYINLAGKTTIPQLTELMKNIDLLIALDSGTTHIAWATQVPKIITIFCCTPKTLYAPLGNESKYIALSGELDCQPCHHKKCKNKNINKNVCTLKPTADQVFEQVEKILV